MATDFDPLDLSTDATYRSEHRTATRRMLMETVANDTAHITASRRRHGLIATGISAAVVGGGTLAYAEFVESAPVTDKGSVRCYSEVTTDFGTDFPGVTVEAPGGSQSDGEIAASPVDLCTYLWEEGLVKRGVSDVPPLVGCVLSDGVAAVFPGDPTTCAELGLPTTAQTG